MAASLPCKPRERSWISDDSGLSISEFRLSILQTVGPSPADVIMSIKLQQPPEVAMIRLHTTNSMHATRSST